MKELRDGVMIVFLLVATFCAVVATGTFIDGKRQKGQNDGSIAADTRRIADAAERAHPQKLPPSVVKAMEIQGAVLYAPPCEEGSIRGPNGWEYFNRYGKPCRLSRAESTHSPRECQSCIQRNHAPGDTCELVIDKK